MATGRRRPDEVDRDLRKVEKDLEELRTKVSQIPYNLPETIARLQNLAGKLSEQEKGEEPLRQEIVKHGRYIEELKGRVEVAESIQRVNSSQSGRAGLGKGRDVVLYVIVAVLAIFIIVLAVGFKQYLQAQADWVTKIMQEQANWIQSVIGQPK